MLLSSFTPIFIDCQSTGASPSTSSLLELGVNDLTWVVEQPSDVPAKILKLIGISSDEILQGASHKDVYTGLKKVLDDAKNPLVIAHFARFEQQFIERLYKMNDDDSWSYEFICTHRLAKRLFPELPSYGIKSLAGYFGTPIATGKRARDHVKATTEIWNALLKELAIRGIESMDSLRDLYNGQAAKRTKPIAFLIPREKRLKIPKKPGVYKFTDRAGRVLYVGKATVLKERVNSYFTGGCRGDHRKLEMLAQATDLEWVALPSPLHAGLLEFDEIQHLKPPYNISFSAAPRCAIETLSILSISESQWSPEALDGAIKNIFYDLKAIDIVREALAEWRSKAPFPNDKTIPVRWLLNQGVPLVKLWIEKKALERAAQMLRHELDQLEVSTKSNQDTDDEDLVEEETPEFQWTLELVTEEFQSMIRRATLQYLRQKWLRRLAKSSIEFYPNKSHVEQNLKFTLEPAIMALKDTRRISLLLHELRRAEGKGGRWHSVAPLTMPFWVS